MNERHNTFGYARVSTDDQDLSMQVAAMIKWGVAPGNIIEEHASGGTMNRPRWNFIFENMREGDTIVIWKIDRLGRTLLGVLETIEAMAKKKVNLISLTDPIDTTTAMGRAFFQMALVFAELERGMISERTKSGIAIKKAQGVRFGRKHSIRDVPERLAEYRRLLETGEIDGMKDPQITAALNAAAPKEPPIAHPNTYRKWRKDEFPGL